MDKEKSIDLPDCIRIIMRKDGKVLADQWIRLPCDSFSKEMAEALLDHHLSEIKKLL